MFDSSDMLFCDFQTDPVVALLHRNITTPVEIYYIIWKRIGVMMYKKRHLLTVPEDL